MPNRCWIYTCLLDGNGGSTKLMILIHGGAWADGDKADFDIYITELKRRLPDYAFANINYRLYTSNGQNKFPAQEEDVKAAVTFLMNKSGDYKYSKNFILLGASAGGHLALLQGYKYANLVNPKAIISFLDLQTLRTFIRTLVCRSCRPCWLPL